MNRNSFWFVKNKTGGFWQTWHPITWLWFSPVQEDELRQQGTHWLLSGRRLLHEVLWSYSEWTLGGNCISDFAYSRWLRGKKGKKSKKEKAMHYTIIKINKCLSLPHTQTTHSEKIRVFHFLIKGNWGTGWWISDLAICYLSCLWERRKVHSHTVFLFPLEHCFHLCYRIVSL